MRNKSLLIFSIFSLTVLCASFRATFAKAPDTPKILFTSQRDGNSEIYIMNADGSGQTNLTRHRAADFNPVWSPTGEQILFVSNRNKTEDLYLMDADGRNVQQLFLKTLRRQHPTWSPDGRKIAYYRVDVLQGEIAVYVASINGEREEYVANGMDPMWAPGTSDIVFVSSDVLIPLNDRFKGIELGMTQIQIVNPKTRVAREFTLPGFPFVFDPAWSPDGTKIAFSGIDTNAIPAHLLLKEDHNLFDEEALYLMNRDGMGVQLIVEADGANPSNPTWGPSGDALIYQRRVGEEVQLFKVTLADAISEQLTHVGSNRDADWFDPAHALPVSPQPKLLSTTWAEMKKR